MIKKLFKDLGFIKNKIIKKKFKIDISSLSKEVNSFNEFIIVKKKSEFKIFDRNCDHAGGRLINSQNSENLTCPFHNWEFNPKKGQYSNGVKKKPIQFDMKDKKIIFSLDTFVPEIKKINDQNKNQTVIKYFNHAFLIVEGKNFKFATDPWAIGPAFNNGWWLKSKTEIDWINQVNKCDFIYISHNHPDHLNSHTLKKISKNKIFIIPKFQHDSIGGLLKKLNFKKIIYLDINKQYQYQNSNLILTILKSGDFRLDSGIYFSNGKFSSLIDVDSNAINFLRLPKVSLYATSYKGGASGYPLMFDNYKHDEKKEIIKKKNNFLKMIKIKNIINLKAKYFLPYASGFYETLGRDKYIKVNNKKLTLNDYQNLLNKKDISVLNTDKYTKFTFIDEKIVSKQPKSKKYYKDKTPNEYLQNFKSQNSKIDNSKIKEYFQNSKYQDNLILNLTLTNDNFKYEYEKFSVKFNHNKPIFLDQHILNNGSENLRFLDIKIRREVFIFTVKNLMPWEDILIGFQCKIKRDPNIFNANFWYYFSNIYINDTNRKYISSCNNCDLFNQKVDNLIYHSAQ